FIFKLIVDVYPEVKLGKYKGVKVEKKEAKVTEEDVLKVLGNIQDRYAKPGPDGKKEVSALDDEFAKKVSRFGTLAELKEEIRSVMLKDREAEADADLKNRLIAEAATDTKADLPPGMVEREIDIMLDELRASLSQNGLTLEDYLKGIKKEEKTLRNEVRRAAEIRAKGKVVLKAIALTEKLAVTPQEIEAEMKVIASGSTETLAEMKKRLGEEGMKYMEEYLLRKKALDFLMAKAKIETAKEEKK
ncbi:MAG: trigger factor, partial [Candidatus Margulisbacteria bacterium]|nr:trigger factor [Candidatus Margulisiibacteriota bacterium]